MMSWKLMPVFYPRLDDICFMHNINAFCKICQDQPGCSQAANQAAIRLQSGFHLAEASLEFTFIT